MPEIDLSRAEWRKSSYSSQSGNCVEVARNPARADPPRLASPARGTRHQAIEAERARYPPPVRPPWTSLSIDAGVVHFGNDFCGRRSLQVVSRV